MKTLQTTHQNFKGNWQDLAQFLQLTASPICSPKRAAALINWGKDMRMMDANFNYCDLSDANFQQRNLPFD